MKVLQVINSLGTGGAEKLLLETLPLYYERGTTVDLLVLDGNEHPFLKELEAINCCDIFSLGKGSVYSPLHVFRIMKFLKKYDIVHVHLFPSLYWVAMAKMLSFSNVRLVYTEHCTTNRRMTNFFLKILDSFIYSFYDKIVCISEEVAFEIKRHVNMHKNTFAVIHNGVNLSKIKEAKPYSKAELSFPDDAVLLVQVSRFQSQKDQPALVRALQWLPENVHLMLVGEGELRQDNEKLAAGLGLSHRVRFLGVRMDVPRLLKSSDIVVLSSHFEGLSLSSIEGLASGNPFVASDAPGLSDIVRGAGLLFPIGDDKALAQTITELIEKPEHRDAVARKCMARAGQYDVSGMVEKHIDLYKSLC
jgi:glycosyltransferase involved in cell wall biosynthesis